MNSQMSDSEILKEIGLRLRRERLNRDLTQARLAKKTGLSLTTIAKTEGGRVTTLGTFVAILRGLELLPRLDQFLPEPSISPVQLAKMKGRQRQRASGKRTGKSPARSDWEWGE